MKMSKIEKTIVIILCLVIPVLVVVGALMKLEHWSEKTHDFFFAAGLFLAALSTLYLTLKSHYNKKYS